MQKFEKRSFLDREVEKGLVGKDGCENPSRDYVLGGILGCFFGFLNQKMMGKF